VALRAENSFWQARCYDFNVWGEREFVEKLRYIHEKRGTTDDAFTVSPPAAKTETNTHP
jgi:hypothetical protein